MKAASQETGQEDCWLPLSSGRGEGVLALELWESRGSAMEQVDLGAGWL